MNSSFFKAIVSTWIASAFLTGAIALAQDSIRIDTVKDNGLAYLDFRFREFKPTYRINEVRAMVSKLTFDDTEGGHYAGKSALAFHNLDPKAKFTYCMICGEHWSQNCLMMPVINNGENFIFARPAEPFSNEQTWSDRQRSFLKDNRVVVTGYIRAAIKESGFVGTNLKKAILEIDTYDLIPDLVSTYRSTKRDLDVLSTLCLLMKHARYAPFTKSAMFNDLYGPNSSFQTHLAFTPEREKFIIDNALALSKFRHHAPGNYVGLNATGETQKPLASLH